MEMSTPFQITSHLGKTGVPTKQPFSQVLPGFETSLQPSGWSLFQQGDRPMKKEKEKQAGDLALNRLLF